jgi:TonB family protein
MSRLIRRASLFAAFYVLAAAATARADDLATATRQLQALRSVVEANPAFFEYERRLLDAKVLIDRYLSGRERSDKWQRQRVREALDLYLDASKAWWHSDSGYSGGCAQAREFLAESRRAAPERSAEAYRTAAALYWRCASDAVGELEGKTRTSWTGPEPLRPHPPLVRPEPPKIDGVGALTLNVTDFPHAWYIAAIHRKIKDRWDGYALPGQQPAVTFEIDRDGGLKRAVVDKSSGNPYYDQAAVRAVTEAAPFPRLPAEFKEPTLTVGLQFAYDPAATR